jgi:XRE family aerobic/anaerobic benzoate catabolism transcriptional regulator
MQYTAAASNKRSSLLRALGAAVRARRTERGMTLRALAKSASVSERFLVQLETGEGNISVARLQDVAEALETSAADLLAARTAPAPSKGIVALLGLRGAGKSTVGAAAAKKLGVPFVELDALVAREAGMSLSTIFEMHGDAYFRRVEREALRKFLDSTDAAVLATGGSIVTAPDTYELLRRRTTTVWLRARAYEHWDRVVQQGDVRPMKNRANAMSELQALLRARKPLYAQADHVVDTSMMTLDEATKRVISTVRH